MDIDPRSVVLFHEAPIVPPELVLHLCKREAIEESKAKLECPHICVVQANSNYGVGEKWP